MAVEAADDPGGPELNGRVGGGRTGRHPPSFIRLYEPCNSRVISCVGRGELRRWLARLAVWSDAGQLQDPG